MTHQQIDRRRIFQQFNDDKNFHRFKPIVAKRYMRTITTTYSKSYHLSRTGFIGIISVRRMRLWRLVLCSTHTPSSKTKLKMRWKSENYHGVIVIFSSYIWLYGKYNLGALSKTEWHYHCAFFEWTYHKSVERWSYESPKSFFL